MNINRKDFKLRIFSELPLQRNVMNPLEIKSFVCSNRSSIRTGRFCGGGREFAG
jgi:hypothetical protein